MHLIQQGEGQTVEFKKTFSAEDKAIRTLCAFANADGGTVFFGVRDDGQAVGVSLGANTRENFANKLKAHSSPLLRPQVDILTVGSQTIVAATVAKAAKGEVFAAFYEFAIRVDRTNQAMSPDEVRRRLLEGKTDSSEERGPPTFEVRRQALRRLETEFEPKMVIGHVSGDQIATLEWRFRGPRFVMDWRQASGSALSRTHFIARFDLSQPPREDDEVGLDEMGFEIRFHWRDRWRHELHRWPLTRREHSGPPPKVLWDTGDEILPPLYFDEADESEPAGRGDRPAHQW